jgi:TIR domain
VVPGGCRGARSLANRFGGDLVFQDVEDIAGGQRWRDTIREAIAAAEVVVVAIGPHWLIDDAGRRRLNDPEDVLRAELVEAFELAKPVVPVLVGGATMPARCDLPDDVSDLSELQTVRLDDMTWKIDAERLLERVRELILPTRGSDPMDRVGQELDRLQRDFFARLDGGDIAGARGIHDNARGIPERTLGLGWEGERARDPRSARGVTSVLRARARVETGLLGGAPEPRRDRAGAEMTLLVPSDRSTPEEAVQ